MLLVCNSPDAVGEVLACWQPQVDPVRQRRVEGLAARMQQPSPETLSGAAYREARARIAAA